MTKASECSLTDKKCICTNTQLNHDITVCVSKSCSVVDSLATKKFSCDSCGVVPQDRTKVISVVGVTFGVLALITFGLRILSKVLRAGGQFGLDDYTITVAMVTIPLSCRKLLVLTVFRPSPFLFVLFQSFVSTSESCVNKCSPTTKP